LATWCCSYGLAKKDPTHQTSSASPLVIASLVERQPRSTILEITHTSASEASDRPRSWRLLGFARNHLDFAQITERPWLSLDYARDDKGA
jgi:hypothetical protein